MKITNINSGVNIRCEIEEDENVGFYIYIYDLSNGKCIKDHLQDTLEIAKAHAEEEFGMNKNDWIEQK